MSGERRARGWAVGLWLLLIALMASWPVWAANARSPVAVAVVVTAVVVLLLPLGGLWKARRRTYGLASLVVAPYVGFGATEVVANPAVRMPAAVMMFLGLACMVALVAYLRISRRDADAAPPAD